MVLALEELLAICQQHGVVSFALDASLVRLHPRANLSLGNVRRRNCGGWLWPLVGIIYRCLGVCLGLPLNHPYALRVYQGPSTLHRRFSASCGKHPDAHVHGTTGRTVPWVTFEEPDQVPQGDDVVWDFSVWTPGGEPCLSFYDDMDSGSGTVQLTTARGSVTEVVSEPR
jgi:hypothetical protein